MAGKFRNIRVKMKGGKTRIQRAMVLASGKLRFVKNTTRSRGKASRHKTTKIRRVIHTARSKHRRSGKSMMQGLERGAQAAAFLAPAIGRMLEKSTSPLGKVNAIIYDYTGYNFQDGQFIPSQIIHGWGPGAMFLVASKVFHKVNGILRRI